MYYLKQDYEHSWNPIVLVQNVAKGFVTSNVRKGINPTIVLLITGLLSFSTLNEMEWAVFSNSFNIPIDFSVRYTQYTEN